MSLAINTTTPEGLVLAADSRQSFRNRKGMARIGSDNASKLFQINERAGVIVTGLAFLSEDGVLKNISKFIDEFKNEVDVHNLAVKEIAEKLNYLFDKKYSYRDQLKKLPEQIKNDLERKSCEVLEIEPEQYFVKYRFKDPDGQVKEGVAGVDRIDLLVAGYNKDGNHEVYICRIPGEVQKKNARICLSNPPRNQRIEYSIVTTALIVFSIVVVSYIP